jgi:gamma-glutamylcyclotransferase (GGCT)/AIG2-like uncharacterized protein YtfP
MPQHPACNVFTYGTLQLPEVMRAVTGGDYPSTPARLPGYARYRLTGLAYPGLRAERGAFTDGVLYRAIDPEALRRLDAFEDTFYRRETLLALPEGGTPEPAETYVVPPEHHGLLELLPWSLEGFRDSALAGFMARCLAVR